MLFSQVGGIIANSVTTVSAAASANGGLAMTWAFLVLGALLVVATVLVSRVPNHRGR